MKRWRAVRQFRRLGRFGRDDSGATAVEFALVAAPFFALIFAILEIALVFFAQQVLDTGVAQASRLIRTGQAKSFDEAQFRQAVCDRIDVMFDCSDDGPLKLEVLGFNSFTDISLDDPVNEDDELRDDFAYDPTNLVGQPNSVVVVRAFYEWPTIVPSFGMAGGLKDGNRLIASTVAFRNEPF